MNHVNADDAISRSDRPRRLRSVQDNRRAHIRDLCILHPCGDTQQSCRFRIGRLESETREISRKVNDVLTRAACDFDDDARHRQDIAKDIENEVAIADCCGRVLAVIDHLPLTFDFALAWLTPRAFVVEILAIRFEASNVPILPRSIDDNRRRTLPQGATGGTETTGAS